VQPLIEPLGVEVLPEVKAHPVNVSILDAGGSSPLSLSCHCAIRPGTTAQVLFEAQAAVKPTGGVL
jgi:hypothetical protein